MFFGLTFEKLILIGVLAVIIVGPQRLPRAAELLAQMIKRGQEFVRSTRNRMRNEMGEEFDDVDWRKLDPRQYDPRRIIREALLDDDPTLPAVDPRAPTLAATDGRGAQVLDAGEVPPYDAEAT